MKTTPSQTSLEFATWNPRYLEFIKAKGQGSLVFDLFLQILTIHYAANGNAEIDLNPLCVCAFSSFTLC